MHMVNLEHWEVLAIPKRDTTKPIPFMTLNDDEYAMVIDTHKQFVTKDPVELSMDKIQGDLVKRLNFIKQLFDEEIKVHNTFYEELFDIKVDNK